jgi:hypothetical protein
MKKYTLSLLLILTGCDQSNLNENTKIIPKEIKFKIEANELYDIEGGKIEGFFAPNSQMVQKVLDQNYPSIHYASLKVLGEIRLKENTKKQKVLPRISESISSSSNIKFGKFMDSTIESIHPNHFILCLSPNATMTLILTQTPKENVFQLSATFVYHLKKQMIND